MLKINYSKTSYSNLNSFVTIFTKKIISLIIITLKIGYINFIKNVCTNTENFFKGKKNYKYLKIQNFSLFKNLKLGISKIHC